MKKILIVICLLIITLLFCEKDEINYQKNVDLELVGYEYNVNEQIYTGNKKQING